MPTGPFATHAVHTCRSRPKVVPTRAKRCAGVSDRQSTDQGMAEPGASCWPDRWISALPQIQTLVEPVCRRFSPQPADADGHTHPVAQRIVSATLGPRPKSKKPHTFGARALYVGEGCRVLACNPKAQKF